MFDDVSSRLLIAASFERFLSRWCFLGFTSFPEMEVKAENVQNKICVIESRWRHNFKIIHLFIHKWKRSTSFYAHSQRNNINVRTIVCRWYLLPCEMKNKFSFCSRYWVYLRMVSFNSMNVGRKKIFSILRIERGLCLFMIFEMESLVAYGWLNCKSFLHKF